VFHALMPAIHDRQTGGSIYNRRMLDYLAKSTPTELYVMRPARIAAGGPADYGLVDSCA
jgi:hypothetical protein